MHALEIHLNPETTEVLDPEEFDFEHHHGHLIPATSWKALILIGQSSVRVVNVLI